MGGVYPVTEMKDGKQGGQILCLQKQADIFPSEKQGG